MADLSFLSSVLACLVASIGFMTLAFAISRAINRTDLIDAMWGPVFIVIALTTVAANGGTSWLGWVVVAMVFVWAGRLAIHIYKRFRVSESEDKRYVELRSKWSAKNISLQIYLKIFLFQAVAALLVSLPVIAVIYSEPDDPTFAIIGSVIWLVGFLFESIADSQLKQFISQNKNRGKLMTKGLWQYSRHPNYFGEIVQWWGIWMLALATQYWLIALIGPVLITFLICFVSGIPPAERAMSTKPEWKKYKQKTSVLMPWPGRS